MAIASNTLKEHGMREQASKMRQRIEQCQSYDSALSIIGDYVNFASVEQVEDISLEMT